MPLSINIDQSNLFKKDHTKSEFDGVLNDFCNNKLDDFMKNPPAFYNVLDDAKLVKSIMDFVKKNNGKFNRFIACGIGGSALGARAICDAVCKNKNLIVLDTIEPDELSELVKSDLSETLFIIISKSGNTLETMAQYFLFQDALEQSNLNWKEHMVFVTGHSGILREIVEKESVETFDIPDDLGGRYSVFSAVGLLPLALAGVDIKALISGAKKARENAISKNPTENVSLRLAVAEFLFNKPISTLFIYSKKLFNVGNFWRQLLAESIGKNENTGILPHVAIGTRDQHSDLQLFVDGPKNKLFTFLIDKSKEDLKMPKVTNKHFGYISQKSFAEIINAGFHGTLKSMLEKDLPVQTLQIDKITDNNIGELIFVFEAEIAFLGQLFGVDPFNQPGVERGKIIAKEILS